MEIYVYLFIGKVIYIIYTINMYYVYIEGLKVQKRKQIGKSDWEIKRIDRPDALRTICDATGT